MKNQATIAAQSGSPLELPTENFKKKVSRFYRRYPPLVMVSILVLIVIITIALFAPDLAPFEYSKIDLHSRLQPPVWLEGGTAKHLLGTDDLGRDVLSRLIFSIRMSLLVAFIGTLVGAVLGTGIGFIAAHFGGWVDDLVMVGIDFQAALPFMIIALAFVAFFGNSIVLFIALMGIYGWERYARITRGLALAARTHGYAVAVTTLGATPFRVYVRHILPNIGSALIVNMTLNFPGTVLMETSLSFLGLGVQPPLTSLGNMLSFGRDYLTSAWWIAVFPGVVIFIATLAMSLLGDWVRDRLDPTLK
jgi:peptide/nickel transport system permease protein